MSEGTVNKWRRALGAKVITEGTRLLFSDWSRVRFTPEVLAKANIRAQEPAAKRKARQTKAARSRLHSFTPEEDALLGTIPDSAVAKRLGCSASEVWNRRTSLKVAPFGKTKARDWSNRLLALDAARLRQLRIARGLSSEEASGQAGISHGRYHTLENGSPTITKKTADALVALFGCSVTDFADPPDLTANRGTPLPAEVIGLLGTIPDHEAAKLAGCCKDAVTRWRNRLGIRAFREREWDRCYPISGDRIRKRYRAAGITVSELISLSGVYKTHLYRIIHGGRRVGHATLDSLPRHSAALRMTL